MIDKKAEKRKLFFSLMYPLLLVIALWVVKGLENYFDLDLATFGILPRTLEGLRGVLFAPLLHAGYEHLVNNSIPILLLGTAVFYFYRPIAWRVFIFSYFLTSLYTWISARYNYHIGASGLVYSLFAFLLLSGFIRRHLRLIAISFLVAFFYGSLVWGVLPWDTKVSWEGHFWGFFVGAILSFYYRKEGPQREVYHWDEDGTEEEDSSALIFQDNQWYSNSSSPKIQITYKENKESDKETLGK